MRLFLNFLQKDLSLELRSKENISLFSSLGVLIAILISFGVSSSFIKSSVILRLLPTFVWLSFFLLATFTLGRSFDQDLEEDNISFLIINKLSLTAFFFSKVISNFLISIIGFISTSVALLVLLPVSLSYMTICQCMIVSIMVIFAFSLLASLLGIMSNQSKISTLLLPLILLPLIFPLFFAALELFSIIIIEEKDILHTSWFSLLCVLNIVYLILGIYLAPYALKRN